MTRAWDAGLLRAPAGFSVVHSVSLAVPRANGARTVVTVHDLAWRHVPLTFPKHGREWHERAFLRAVASGADIVVPSDPVADEVHRAGVKRSKVTVIEPGVDHLPEPDNAAADKVLERLGVRERFLLSVGTLEPRKNLDMLSAAYSDVRDSLPGRWPLVVVGPAGWGPGLEPRDGVVLAGHVSPGMLSALYAKAELLAYVPLVEGFGLPPLEAMRAGTPVVASEVPSVKGAALLVDPSNRKEIADGLLAVSTDSSLRDRLVKDGRARVAQLTWKECASRHVGLWRAVAELQDVTDPLRLSYDATAVPPQPVGAGRYTIDLARALGSLGEVETSIWCRSGDAARIGTATGGTSRILARAPRPRAARLVWEQAVLPGLVDKLGVDVHHAPHYTMPERCRTPVVVTVHDLTFFDHPEWHERSKVLVFRRAIRVAARRADVLVCVSSATAERLAEHLKPRGRVVVVPHGVDSERFRPPAAGEDEVDESVLRRAGVRRPYVLFVGTQEPRKAIPDLVEAFDRVASSHEELSLVLAGGRAWGASAVDSAVKAARHRERVRQDWLCRR